MKKNDLITHAEKNSYVARNLQKSFIVNFQIRHLISKQQQK